MKYCINCGVPLEDSMRFCSECGAKQQVEQTQESGAGQPGGFGGNTPPQYQPPYGGASTSPYGGVPSKPKSNGLAIAGFVVSLCAVLFVLVPVAGLVISLVALGLSIAGMTVASHTRGASGMAIAGLVLSLIFTLTSIYYLIAGI